MRWCSALVAVVAVGCASRDVTESRDCDGALENIVAPRSPAVMSDLLPLAVGDPLPVHEITFAQYDADGLVERALAIACIATGDSVEAGADAWAWAEEAVDSVDGRQVRARVFDPPMDVRFVRWPGGAIDVGAWRSNDADPRGTCDDPPIDRDVALDAAEGKLAEYRSRGLVNDVPHRLILESGPDSHVSDACGPEGWIRVFYFEALVGGIPVPGAGFKVSVDANGQAHGASALTFDGEPSGTLVAARTDAEAIARFSDLAQEIYPTAELAWEVLEVSYLLPSTATDPSEVEPVVYGRFVVKSGGVVGRPQSYTLSLADADATLVPL